jgi:hypothetical protein
LKDKDYKSNSQTEEGLKENICGNITNISAEELQRVSQNLFCQCEECLHKTALSVPPVICKV